MVVTLKLYAGLSDYLPPGGREHRVDIEVGADEPVAAIVERFRLPAKLVHLVLVNGVFVPPAERATRRLQPADHLAIWPPIAGG